MEDIDVVHSQVQKQRFEVHRVDGFPDIFKDDFCEFVDEAGDSSVGLGLEVEKGMLFDKVVEEALPVLKNRDPLVVMQ